MAVLMRATWPLLLVLAGCYSPDAPSGSYLCGGAPEHACPSGQHCTCGQCVKSDLDAACRFKLSPLANASPSVGEHEVFQLLVEAQTASGATATGFQGTATFSSNWGDVSPPTIALASGTAMATISLNRETLRGQVAYVTVALLAVDPRSGLSTLVSSRSNPIPIVVTLPPLTFPQAPLTGIVGPPFGWATTLVGQPSVLALNGSYRMYFYGVGGATTGVGVATSSDGFNWTPQPQPVLPAEPNEYFISPAVYGGTGGSIMAYSSLHSPFLRGDGRIREATSPDGLMVFQRPQAPGGVLLDANQCPYCGSLLTFPSVVLDLSRLGPADAGIGPILHMYFSALRTGHVPVIGRALSPDGIQWAPDPFPILKGDLTEPLLLSPRVYIDGRVYKMWYSYAPPPPPTTASNNCVTVAQCRPPYDDCRDGTCVVQNDLYYDFCTGALGEINIGYATSSDGIFWVPSPSTPLLRPRDVRSVIVTHALLAGAVAPASLTDARAGMNIYVVPFVLSSAVGGRCLPAAILQLQRN